MIMHSFTWFFLRSIPVLLIAVCAQAQDDPFLNAFAPGREYFMLRSGNARMIIESNAAGTQPAVTYLLFDANKPCQTLRKERAFNYERGRNCITSALEVIIGTTRFTAVPHTTKVRWQQLNGIPAVEARWWAGGIRVTETFIALAGENTFIRRISLDGADLAGPDSVSIRLSLPAGQSSTDGSMLAAVVRNTAIAIGVLSRVPATVSKDEGWITAGPLSITPGGHVSLSTCLVLRTPLPGFAPEPGCDDEIPVPVSAVKTAADQAASPGLTGAYFNNATCAGAPTLVRTDTILSPYWGTNAPASGIRPDSFSVRWTGVLVPPRTGRYRISLTADDRARIYLNDALLLDRWENACNVRAFADIDLREHTSVPVRIDYADLTGFAGMRFRWTVPPSAPDHRELAEGISQMFAFMRTLDDSPADSRMGVTQQSWRLSSTLSSRDTMLNRVYDNARFALPGMVGPLGKMDAGVFEYGDQWVRDGSNVTLGLLHAGHFEAARALLTHILKDLVAEEGATIVAGAFDEPDREEFDQMGELMHTLKAWLDWTDDTSLVIPYRKKLLTMIERPLRPSFRDATGMVHNRREFWERTFTEGYELAYQTFMVQGLRDAADLAPLLGAPENAARWRKEADTFLQAMLHHPTHALVDSGHLIKRRNADGSVADLVPGLARSSGRDDPASTEAFHRLNPDASEAIPIFLRIVDPRSSLAIATLNTLEGLWNARWDIGGYERYHSSSQQDQPGPWCFATGFMARAQHEAGLYDRSYRSIAWLAGIQGGNAGAWPEEIPLNRTQIPSAGVVPWTSAEVTVFVVRHMLGVWFEGRDLVLRPSLFPGDKACRADLRFRGGRIHLLIERSGKPKSALVNGKVVHPRKSDGAIVIPGDRLDGDLTIRVVL